MSVKKTEATERLEIRLKYLFEHGIDLDSRIITFSTEIDSNLFSFIDAAVTELERHNNRAITIRINSEGGSVYDALAIVGRLHGSKCNIITEGYGAIMSAATLILASGWKRRVSKFATFMHHEAAYGVEGRHSTLVNEVKEMERLEKQWSRWMAEFSNKPAAFFSKEGRFTDSYFTPQELLEMGLVDEIF